MTLPPAIEDLGAEEDDGNKFTKDPHNEEEDEVQCTYPDKEDDDNDDEEEDKDDDDEVQVVSWLRPHTNKSMPNEAVVFNLEIHDITGYEKADIIEHRNTAFNSDAMYTKRVKGTLLGLRPGSMPSSQQINSSELFALRAPTPQNNRSENDDEDEEGPHDEANIHDLWLPFLKGNKALGNYPPSQFKPPADWPKVYTSEGLQTHFSMGVTTWKSCEPLPRLIIVVPPDSLPLEKAHFLDHLHSHTALMRYFLGAGKWRKQFAFCPYCGIRSENQVAAYSHAR